MSKNTLLAGPVREQKYRKRQRTVEAVQFTGLNGSDVVNFIQEHGGEAKNGGKWVSAILPGSEERTVIRKYDFVAWELPGVTVYEYDDFVFNHLVRDAEHVVMVPPFSKSLL